MYFINENLNFVNELTTKKINKFRRGDIFIFFFGNIKLMEIKNILD